MHLFKHFCTVNKHRFLVMVYCFRCGIPWRGLVHDLSKYSPTEFFSSAKYYTGTSSPITNERNTIGYSKAWLHHKGHNKHHLEYWVFSHPESNSYRSVQMPIKYVKESICDRISATKTYYKKNYNDSKPLEYYLKSGGASIGDPQTRELIKLFLEYVEDLGIKKALKKIRKIKSYEQAFKEKEENDK